MYLLVQCNGGMALRMIASQSKCQIVCFRTGINKIADGQLGGQGIGDALCARHQLIVQEAIVGA